MKFATFIIVICFSAQVLARPKPDDVVQEFLDSIKRRISDALNQVQEMATRALESAKSAVLSGLQTAQDAAKQGIETGQSFVKFGENTARKFIEETAKAVPRVDNPLESNTSAEIPSEVIPVGQIPSGEIPSGQIPSGQIPTENSQEIEKQNGGVPFPSLHLPFGKEPSETINFT